MLRRWRVELAKHAEDPHPACHCLRGPGFLRKRRPYGCGNPRCGVCHYDKFYARKTRAARRSVAINYELAAGGSGRAFDRDTIVAQTENAGTSTTS